MRSILVITACALSGLTCLGQQTKQYSQYLLNAYGLNPAVCGTKECIDVKLGYRQQWVGFPGAPKSMFGSIHGAIGKNKTYNRGWHGIGIYIEKDEHGPFSTQSVLPSYAYHLHISRGWVAALGFFVGIRQYVFNQALANGANANDPVLSTGSQVLTYPDITPGLWIYSKSMFIGLAAHQVYKTKIKGPGGQIGSPSKAKQHYYFHLGKKIKSQSYYYTFVPSMHVKYTLLYPPSVDFSFMWYIKNKTGFGLQYRYPDAVTGLIDLRLLKFLTVGYAFDLTTSRLRRASSNTHEVIVGLNLCRDTGFGEPKQICPAYN